MRSMVCKSGRGKLGSDASEEEAIFVIDTEDEAGLMSPPRTSRSGPEAPRPAVHAVTGLGM
jgi:hypothetical protein